MAFTRSASSIWITKAWPPCDIPSGAYERNTSISPLPSVCGAAVTCPPWRRRQARTRLSVHFEMRSTFAQELGAATWPGKLRAPRRHDWRGKAKFRVLRLTSVAPGCDQVSTQNEHLPVRSRIRSDDSSALSRARPRSIALSTPSCSRESPRLRGRRRRVGLVHRDVEASKIVHVMVSSSTSWPILSACDEELPFIDQALKASEGVAGLSAAVRGLIAARQGADLSSISEAAPTRLALTWRCRRLLRQRFGRRNDRKKSQHES